MTKQAYANLSRSFHEPARLNIMTLLVSHAEGLSFAELKTQCDLTDGNLNRHLKVLVDEDYIIIDKTKPRNTQVLSSKHGVDSFLKYLDELERVVRTAVRSTKLRSKS